MKITLRCFASVRELLGADVLELDIPDGTTMDGLKQHLAADHPNLLKLPLAQAVNQGYAAADHVLQDGDEVAFIPPISGGAPEPEPRWRFEFVDGPIEVAPLERAAMTDHDGAVVVFSGVTRNHNEGQAVSTLRYEAYREMAEAKMAEILEEVCAALDVGRVRVVHRLGEVPIGEASVVVVAASAHRGPAFDAARLIMERLKKEVPIFKQELLDTPSGEARWVGDLPSSE